MTEPEDDLRAIAEDIAADAAELSEVEEEKAQLDPDDPRTTRLAREGERLARGILPKTIAERRFVEEADEEARRGRPN